MQPSTVQRLKDTGCLYFFHIYREIIVIRFIFNLFIFVTDQVLELTKANSSNAEAVRGQIIVSLLSRDGGSVGRSPLAVVGPAGDVQVPQRDRSPPRLPNGWEERTTNNGRYRN